MARIVINGAVGGVARTLTARKDGVSNTITGVQKDNWILCVKTK